MQLNKITRIINLVMILFGVLFFFFLVWYDINPSGKRSIEHSFKKPNKLVYGPYPADRLTNKSSENYWEVVIDPIYFDLYIPRLYQRISFSAIFQTDSDKAVIALGGLGSDQGWQITLKPAYNGYLENLSLNCKVFLDDDDKISVCAGRNQSLPEMKIWQDIFRIFPDADYVMYYLPADKMESIDKIDNLKIGLWENSLTENDFDFLLTGYQPPEDLGDGWKKATVIFSPDELWLAGHIYKFVISIPDLSNRGGQVKLQAVEFYLEKEPINRYNFQEKFLRFWQRLKSRF